VPFVVVSSRESSLSFEDNIYVINFIYFTHWLFCIHFIIGMSRNLFPDTHIMSIGFVLKTGCEGAAMTLLEMRT
jgi:hypothetical protein